MHICERVTTDYGKVGYCKNEALFISPPGIFTPRIINVCFRHKEEISNLFIKYGKKAQFKTLPRSS